MNSTADLHARFLWAAIDHADQAGKKGNRPFGAVLVRDGKIIFEAVVANFVKFAQEFKRRPRGERTDHHK